MHNFTRLTVTREFEATFLARHLPVRLVERHAKGVFGAFIDAFSVEDELSSAATCELEAASLFHLNLDAHGFIEGTPRGAR